RFGSAAATGLWHVAAAAPRDRERAARGHAFDETSAAGVEARAAARGFPGHRTLPPRCWIRYYRPAPARAFHAFWPSYVAVGLNLQQRCAGGGRLKSSSSVCPVISLTCAPAVAAASSLKLRRLVEKYSVPPGASS